MCWLPDVLYTAAPTGKSQEQLLCTAFQQGRQRQPRNPYEESTSWTCTQSCPGMLGAMPSVDAVITNVNVSHWSLTLRVLRALRGKEEDARDEVEAHGTLCKEMADKRGHLPAQATATLA